MLYMLYFSLFMSVIFLVWGLFNILFSKKIVVSNRLQLFTEDKPDKDVNELKLKEAALNILGILGKVVSKDDYLEKKQKDLRQAHIHMHVEEFIGMSIILGFIITLILYFLSKSILVSIVGLPIGYLFPNLILNVKKTKRAKQLNEQLPEALSILSNGLRAGFSFSQALTVTANESDTPLKDEFLRVVRDNSLGLTLEESLTNMSDRTDDEDIDMLVTALIIQRKVGGNLSEILDTISETVRDRMRIRGEISSLTAQGRLSAMVVSLMPFAIALFIFVVNPEYIMKLFSNRIGIILVVVAMFMQLFGIYLIMSMSNIEI